MNKIIYTDGSCINNAGDGGWAWILIEDNKVSKKDFNKVAGTTNNRMEMTAAIEAIKSNDDNLDIYTDSIYLKNGITIWIHSWLKTNWKNNKIKNIDLWKELWNLVSSKNINWHWIKAHSTNQFNNEVDILANRAAKS